MLFVLVLRLRLCMVFMLLLVRTRKLTYTHTPPHTTTHHHTQHRTHPHAYPHTQHHTHPHAHPHAHSHPQHHIRLHAHPHAHPHTHHQCVLEGHGGAVHTAGAMLTDTDAIVRNSQLTGSVGFFTTERNASAMTMPFDYLEVCNTVNQQSRTKWKRHKGNIARRLVMCVKHKSESPTKAYRLALVIE